MNANNTQPKSKLPTVGSLFAGIGGLDLGFEQAGFRTAWQVEINDICREVLRDRFPHAIQHTDVRTCLPALTPVDVIVGGFPCQDVSSMGKRVGLHGERTGLFFDAMRIVESLKPKYIVLENVCGLINSNDGKDLETVIKTLAKLRYVGYWRVLDSRYFGVPQKRRRVFLVAGLGRLPPAEFMADTAAIKPVSKSSVATKAGAWENAMPTLLAGFASGTDVAINGSNIIAVGNGRGEMVKWERAASDYGFRKGLVEADIVAARAAGNAVCPQVAQWIAEKLIKAF